MGPPKIIKEPYEEENMIKFQAQGTKPMNYLWFKDDRELCDGENYKGTTTPELHIMGSGQQVRGKFKCRVTNEYGPIETHFKYGMS